MTRPIKKAIVYVFEFLRINGRWALRRLKDQPMKDQKNDILLNRFKDKEK